MCSTSVYNVYINLYFIFSTKCRDYDGDIILSCCYYEYNFVIIAMTKRNYNAFMYIMSNDTQFNSDGIYPGNKQRFDREVTDNEKIEGGGHF